MKQAESDAGAELTDIADSNLPTCWWWYMLVDIIANILLFASIVSFPVILQAQIQLYAVNQQTADEVLCAT
jgi:hypothetical protein